MDLDDLYSELIMDHFRNPRGKGDLPSPSAVAAVVNPLCGDKISISIRNHGSIVDAIMYTGSGCSISQASASMLAACCTGKTSAEVSALCKLFKKMMSNQAKGADVEVLGDAVALEGIKNFPARLRCALLAWEGLEQCLTKIGQDTK